MSKISLSKTKFTSVYYILLFMVDLTFDFLNDPGLLEINPRALADVNADDNHENLQLVFGGRDQ